MVTGIHVSQNGEYSCGEVPARSFFPAYFSFEVCFSMKTKLLLTLSVSLLSVAVAGAQNAGALGNGVSSRATSLGGATVASAITPLEAMQSNPAALSELDGRSVDLSFSSMFATGSFTNSVSNNGTISPFAGVLPYGAFAMPIAGGRLKLGVSVAPDVMMMANWKYMDPPGGINNTTYGLQQNKSGILGLRYAGGLAFSVNKKFSIGGTVGAIYNRNTLQAPYIFQQEPTLAGAKVLLDLHTAGTGWNGSFGALYTPSSKVKFGVSYKTKTTVHSHGDASGNARQQFDALGATTFQPDFHYDAEVITKFPQAVSAGVSWQAHKRLRLNLQGNWIGWSNAFDNLPVHLTNGSNADLNGFVGSNSLNDVIPVQWRNQGVFGVGVESPLGEHIAFRGGYSYATNPVPSATLTPMTAAILQNTLGTGLGYSRGRYNFDFAYQVQLPASQRVGTSSLLSGEYDNSRVEVAVQSLTLTSRIHF
jgi:long-subunit fatty acid transport protein